MFAQLGSPPPADGDAAAQQRAVFGIVPTCSAPLVTDTLRQINDVFCGSEPLL